MEAHHSTPSKLTLVGSDWKNLAMLPGMFFMSTVQLAAAFFTEKKTCPLHRRDVAAI